MSYKPTGLELANQALVFLNGGLIPYRQWDCQAFMEEIVRACGGSMSYAGSNDMIRNACTWVGTLAEAKRLGYLVPGVALFIVEQNGAEPAKYRGDGIGNASHVGMYIGENAFYDPEKGRMCNVAHSSASRGKVCGSTLQNAWTHVGIWKCANFSGLLTKQTTQMVIKGSDTMAEVIAYPFAETGSTVNMRSKQSTSSGLVARVPIGSQVTVVNQGDQWSKVQWENWTGYIKNSFLRSDLPVGTTNPVEEVVDSSPAQSETGSDVVVTSDPVDRHAIYEIVEELQAVIEKLASLIAVG